MTERTVNFSQQVSKALIFNPYSEGEPLKIDSLRTLRLSFFYRKGRKGIAKYAKKFVFLEVPRKENPKMLRSSLCLLLTALFMSAAWAQQRHTDVQSLQYEFGQNVRVQPTPPVFPCPCAKPVVYAPVARPYCYASCYSPCYYPKPKYRRAFVRPVHCLPRSVYYSPYYRW